MSLAVRHFGQELPSESFGFGCEPAALIIGEPQPAFTQLFLQDTILFAQVLNPVELALIHPSGHRHKYKPKRIKRLSICHYANAIEP